MVRRGPGPSRPPRPGAAAAAAAGAQRDHRLELRAGRAGRPPPGSRRPTALTVRKVRGSASSSEGWKLRAVELQRLGRALARRSGARRRRAARARRPAAPSSPRSRAATPAATEVAAGVAVSACSRPPTWRPTPPGLIIEITLSTYSGNRATASSSTPPAPWRSAQLVTGSVPGARPMPRSIRPGYAASSSANCSATTSGAWLGSITPPEPDPDPRRWPRRPARSAAAGWSPRRPACCGARPASSGGSRARSATCARLPRRREGVAGGLVAAHGHEVENGELHAGPTHGRPPRLPGDPCGRLRHMDAADVDGDLVNILFTEEEILEPARARWPRRSRRTTRARTC